jgi:hypothetical protein
MLRRASYFAQILWRLVSDLPISEQKMGNAVRLAVYK